VPYLIVSDIHGNYEALEAVLEHARGRYDKILCLGDLVGYGADPNPVAEWAKLNVASVVRGNHDRACTGTDSLEYFNPSARASALWTRGVLTPANLS
jgi:predicted phosphodiesterase